MNMRNEARSNSNVVSVCRDHVIFCPKYRRQVLTPPIDERLKIILAEQIERWGQELIEREILPDHVHLLVGCDPQFGIHRLVKLLKGDSSHALRAEFPVLKRRLPSLWTNSYFVSTTGGVTLETLKRYVEHQKGKCRLGEQDTWQRACAKPTSTASLQRMTKSKRWTWCCGGVARSTTRHWKSARPRGNVAMSPSATISRKPNCLTSKWPALNLLRSTRRSCRM